MIFRPVPIMPRVVLTDDLEKLIEIWAEYQRNKTGKIMKRSLKEKYIASAVFAEYSAEKKTSRLQTPSLIATEKILHFYFLF